MCVRARVFACVLVCLLNEYTDPLFPLAPSANLCGSGPELKARGYRREVLWRSYEPYEILMRIG